MTLICKAVLYTLLLFMIPQHPLIILAKLPEYVLLAKKLSLKEKKMKF